MGDAGGGRPGSTPGWREDHLGSRDLTAWPSRAGRMLVRVATRVAGRARRLRPERELPWLVLAMTALVGGGLAIALTSVSAEIYDDVTERDGVASLDQPVLNTMMDWRSPGLDSAVTHYTDLGSVRMMPLIVVLAAIVLCWWWRRATPALLLLIAAAGSVVMTATGKALVGRVRPPTDFAVPPFEDSASFPSGHTLNSWVLFLLIAYLVAVRATRRLVGVLAIAVALALAVAMGLSRVYLGHHWLTDVLVGWTLGSAWLAAVVTGHRLALTVRRWSATARSAPDSGPD